MEKTTRKPHMKGFLPYALAAFLVGIVGGFSTVLGPAFVKDLDLPYNNTTWTALATAMSTAAFAPVLGKLGDAIGRRKTLLLGIAIYTLGNLLTAIAVIAVYAHCPLCGGHRLCRNSPGGNVIYHNRLSP